MSRHSEIKKAVLRGVYEDNAGISRSVHRPVQSKHVVAAHVPATSQSRYRGRVLLIVMLAVVALIGVNFRLVTVDGSGPIAMQVVKRQSLQIPEAPLSELLNPEDDRVLAREGPSSFEPARDVKDAALMTSGDYVTMLTSLGMPVADLFNLRVQTIVIDPGHGGIDPGATGRHGLKEKDVTLDIARRLRDKLTESGDYRVLLTREEDRKVFLKERVAFAKKNRADLFISIHINSLPPGSESVNYIETYYFGPHTDQRSLDLAEKENHDSDYVMGDFREVIARIGDTLKTEESRELASSIHTNLFSDLKRLNRDLIDAGSKTGPFMVLLGVEVPSVLVEISCISNKAEETRLSQPEYRDSVADFLEAGIVEYLQRRAYPGTIVGGKTQNVAQQER